MTILLLCKMFGVPTSRLTSILAVDWLINRLNSVCKTLTHSTAVAVVAHMLKETLQAPKHQILANVAP